MFFVHIINTILSYLISLPPYSDVAIFSIFKTSPLAKASSETLIHSKTRLVSLFLNSFANELYKMADLIRSYIWTMVHVIHSGVFVWFWFWRYLTRGLIWHLSQSSIGLHLILVRLWNHARIRS